VDGIERALPDTRLVRLSTGSGAGLEVAGRYGVRGLPTLIVFDGSGQPVLTQVGRVRRDGVMDAATAAIAAGAETVTEPNSQTSEDR